MILVMKAEIAEASTELAAARAFAESFPGIKAEVYAMQGTTRPLVEVHLHGDTATLPTQRFEELDGVERVVRVTEKYRTIGRHARLDSLGFEYQGVTISQDSLEIFAGLCAVDTRDNVERTFAALAAAGLRCARAGAYKPRTSPYDFQGHGAACLPFVFELAGKHGIRIVAMEVTSEAHVDEIQRALAAAGQPCGVILQIGTRNAQNFELLKAVGAQSELPVLYKRGLGITLEESLNACEYVASGGNRRVIFGLRGMRTSLGDPHRNFVDFAHVPVLRRLTRLPICIDPSHSVGRRTSGPDGLSDIFHVTAQGVIAGANMILVDFHPRPGEALCDGPQALVLEELPLFLEDVRLARDCYLARARVGARLAAVSQLAKERKTR